jgi:hypothetical protein
MSRADAAMQDDLVSALLDYQAAPGRYAPALRQPEVLYRNVRALLQICLNRQVSGLFVPENRARDVRSAAAFFLKTVILRTGSDHYTLLGVERNFEASQLRENYRLWMRLTHPDHADETMLWPADAATRINIAHDALMQQPRMAAADTAADTARPQTTRPVHRPQGKAAPTRGGKTSARTMVAWTVAVLCVLGGGAYWLLETAMPSAITVNVQSETKPAATVRQRPASEPPAVAVDVLPLPASASVPVVVDAAPVILPPQPSQPMPPPTLAPVSPPMPAMAQATKPAPANHGLSMPRVAVQPSSGQVSALQRAATAPEVLRSQEVGAPLAVAEVPVPRAEAVVHRVEVPAPKPTPSDDVRAALERLILAMGTGDWRNLEAAMAPGVRSTRGGKNLVQTYRHMVGDGKQVRLAGVKLQLTSGQAAAMSADVQTRMDLSGAETSTIELNWKAVVVKDGERVHLLKVSVAGE